MATNPTPRRGLRFLHSTWLNVEDHTPMTFEVSAIRKGLVYYRPIYKDGSTGKPYIDTIDNFPTRVKQYLGEPT